MSYTDEELEGLSEEEREALESEEQDEEETAILREIADGQDDEEAVEGKGEVEAGDKETAEVVAEEPEEAVTEQNDFQPQYQVAPVEGYDAKMAEFAEVKKALRTQLNDGSISLDEYDERKDAILDQERDLREHQFKSQIASEQNQQAALQRWQWEQERFFADEKNALYKDRYLLVAFDAAVKDLAADENNANKSAQFFLQEADRIVRERFNAKDAKEQSPRPSRKPDLTLIPKTLGQLPSAELPETGGDEFAHLDKLDGIALERALSKLSSEQQVRYLEAAG